MTEAPGWNQTRNTAVTKPPGHPMFCSTADEALPLQKTVTYISIEMFIIPDCLGVPVFFNVLTGFTDPPSRVQHVDIYWWAVLRSNKQILLYNRKYHIILNDSRYKTS